LTITASGINILLIEEINKTSGKEMLHLIFQLRFLSF